MIRLIHNDNITHSANANNVDEHVVSIEATNYMQFMNMTGVFGFHLPSLELSDPLTFAKSGYDGINMAFKLNPGGAKSERAESVVRSSCSSLTTQHTPLLNPA